MLDENRSPSDPKERAQWEEAQVKLARTKADQERAKLEAEAEVKHKQEQAERDRQHIEEVKALREQERQRRAKEQADARKRYLATPLTEEEEAELRILELQANQPGSPNPEAMHHLSDLRIRSKLGQQAITGEETPKRRGRPPKNEF